ncbi:MAG: response regulator [Candidatus Kapabacteria bacterium]|nr:response regulator [Candidatus Kapabacteria bacterium]
MIKLLIVDDELDFLDTITKRMELRGFEVSKAPDGYKALDLLEKSDFDVVVLDLKMPGIDGLEVLEKIKKNKKNTEIIIYSAHGSEEVASKTLELGAFSYITKPIEIDKLISVINLAVKASKKNQKSGSINDMFGESDI